MLKRFDRQILDAFPEGPVSRFEFMVSLPLEVNRNSAGGALKRLLDAGLLHRPRKGVYELTAAGLATRQEVPT